MTYIRAKEVMHIYNSVCACMWTMAHVCIEVAEVTHRELDMGQQEMTRDGCSIVSFPCWSPLYSSLCTYYMCPCSISCFPGFFCWGHGAHVIVGEEIDPIYFQAL